MCGRQPQESCPAWGDVGDVEPQQPQPQPVGHGPGTELKKLLAKIGIVSTPDCSCNRVAAEMDAWGPDECEQPERMAYIVAAMRENAERRGMPFLDVAAKLLVRRAIKNARRAAEWQSAASSTLPGNDGR